MELKTKSHTFSLPAKMDYSYVENIGWDLYYIDIFLVTECNHKYWLNLKHRSGNYTQKDLSSLRRQSKITQYSRENRWDGWWIHLSITLFHCFLFACKLNSWLMEHVVLEINLSWLELLPEKPEIRVYGTKRARWLSLFHRLGESEQYHQLLESRANWWPANADQWHLHSTKRSHSRHSLAAPRQTLVFYTYLHRLSLRFIVFSSHSE